jgi:hypothetical protein
MENLSFLFKSKNSNPKTQCLYLFEVLKYLKYVWEKLEAQKLLIEI